MAIARTVQDLSAETSLKLSSFDARLQALETSYQTNLQSMDERMKNMEDMVKVMKESLDKALTSIPFKFQGINDRLQFVQSRIDAFEKFMDPSGIK
ncbi:hypothetical protein B0O80DRAFT_433254 [Mortierella sp. GBAus27b]|nr:hypothetical protein B0O80DRAFT_433254 [Mortierella sp. GBAus27b]